MAAEALRRSTQELLQKTSAPASASSARAAIRAIDTHLQRTKNLPRIDRKALYSAKSGLLSLLLIHVREEILREVEDSLNQAVALDPTDPVALLAIADFHFYQTKRLDAALQWIERAAACADNASEFVRLVYGQMCRLAVALNRPDLIERSLQRLVEYRLGSPADIALERDLPNRIPEGAVSPDLLDRYRSLLVDATKGSRA